MDILRELIDYERFDRVKAIKGVIVLIFAIGAFLYIRYSPLGVQSKFVVYAALDVLCYLVMYHWISYRYKYAVLMLTVNIVGSIIKLFS